MPHFILLALGSFFIVAAVYLATIHPVGVIQLVFLLGGIYLVTFRPALIIKTKHFLINIQRTALAGLQQLSTDKAVSDAFMAVQHLQSSGSALIHTVQQFSWTDLMEDAKVTLQSSGSALIHTVQQFSWTDLMEDAKVTLQSLKDWCIILMNLAIKASGTHWGRLMLLMAAVLLVNNLLALIRAIGVLVKIPISVVRLVYKVMAYVVGLLTRMAIFPFRLLWNMTVFLYHRLF